MKLLSEREWIEELHNKKLEMPPMPGPSLFKQVTVGIIVYIAVALILHMINPL